MNFEFKFNTKDQEESFLKTRIEYIDLPEYLENSLLRKSIFTVRGLIAINNFNNDKIILDHSAKNIITQKLVELMKKINDEELLKKIPLNENTVYQYPSDIDGKDVITFISNHFKIEKSIILSSSRKKGIVRIRDIIIYILRKYAEISFPSIGKMMGDRDHTTIIHSYKKMEKEYGDQPDFEKEFQKIISQVILLKKINEEEALAYKNQQEEVKNLLFFSKQSEELLKTLKPIIIPERNVRILQLYREGLSLNKIGKSENVTRERIRQIVASTVKSIAFNKSLEIGEKVDFNVLLKEEKEKRIILIREKKPKKLIKQVRKWIWSGYYEKCKSCETMKIPHFKNGLCEECGNKSITGDERNLIIKEHKNKCDSCSIDRQRCFEKFGRDFYLSRKNKSVLCRECFQKITGGILSKTRKNKWRMFYN